MLDFDAEGRVVGFEVEHASTVMDVQRIDLGALPVERLIWTRVPSVAV